MDNNDALTGGKKFVAGYEGRDGTAKLHKKTTEEIRGVLFTSAERPDTMLLSHTEAEMISGTTGKPYCLPVCNHAISIFFRRQQIRNKKCYSTPHTHVTTRSK
jgi:hypothetical protein